MKCLLRVSLMVGKNCQILYSQNCYSNLSPFYVLPCDPAICLHYKTFGT